MQSVTYRLTAADLADGRRYAYEKMPVMRAMRLAAIAIGVGYLIYAAYQAYAGEQGGMAGAVASLVTGAVLLFWLFFANRLLLPYFARRQLARSKGMQGDITAAWDAGQISFDSSHGQSRWPWGDLDKWLESSKGLLLWQSNLVFIYLPKRALSEAQLAELRGLLTAGVGAAGKRRR